MNATASARLTEPGNACDQQVHARAADTAGKIDGDSPADSTTARAHQHADGAGAGASTEPPPASASQSNPAAEHQGETP